MHVPCTFRILLWGIYRGLAMAHTYAEAKTSGLHPRTRKILCQELGGMCGIILCLGFGV